MFDIDRWREVFQSIANNKLRSILSGFTIAFAIMLFTLLFGMGNGLKNTFKKQFAGTSMNTIYLWGNTTTKAYKGNQIDRKIQFKNDDLDFIKKNFSSKIDVISPIVQRNLPVTYKTEKYNYPITGVYSKYNTIKGLEVTQGRFLNQRDLQDRAKVIVIGRLVEKDLFDGKSAFGKQLNIGGVVYKVIGVYIAESGKRDERDIYVPFSTLQRMYGNTTHVDEFVMLFSSKLSIDQGLTFGVQLKKALKKKHEVSPKDQRGIMINNFAQGNKAVTQMMTGLGILILVIGFGTLIAGVVGISNIMVYVVKERTKELGIRKAIGATPKSIVNMIMFEAIIITAISGYLGLLLGIGTLAIAAPTLENFQILNPSVSTSVVVGATITLVLSGMIAGYLPAKKAARIKPIVALRAD